VNAKENCYYVYCYIDPRNLEVFYYGKGTGNRSHAHLLDEGQSEKAERIRQIKRETEKDPIIRIIATDLSHDEALLVEAALIWSLRDRLTNKVSGHFTKKFRPQNTFHKRLVGFDFARRIHFFNVGDSGESHRCWEDNFKYGFLSSGYGLRYKRCALQLDEGDIVAAYLSKYGYVGIGIVQETAVPARDFLIQGKSLKKLKLKAPDICHDAHDLEKCEYVIKIKWLIAKDRLKAIKSEGGVPRQTRVYLDKRTKVLRFLEESFGVRFEKILEQIED
jgi:hypothetical protein